MFYILLANIVLVVHLCFVLFVVFGGLLVLFRKRYLWLHLPALAWGAAVEFFALQCPLTNLEKYLQRLGGADVYAGDFINRMLSSILYPQITFRILTLLGVLLVVFNLIVYLFVFYRLRQSRNERVSL